jgi:arsenate reductase-like glutaredoxin family protein
MDKTINEFKNSHPDFKWHDPYDLSSFVSLLKQENAYYPYTVERLNEVCKKLCENKYTASTIQYIWEGLDAQELVDLLNTKVSEILQIITKDHEYGKKHSVMNSESYEDEEEVLHVEVYSSKGLIKKYNIPLRGFSREELFKLLKKERNE